MVGLLQVLTNSDPKDNSPKELGVSGILSGWKSPCKGERVLIVPPLNWPLRLPLGGDSQFSSSVEGLSVAQSHLGVSVQLAGREKALWGDCPMWLSRSLATPGIE